ncbi:MAG: GNAT family N-acetyltransferase [Cyanobacteria bacterium P01_G01_bin.19]
MNFKQQDIDARGIRIVIIDNGIEVGRAYIYLMQNDLHDRPFGLMEDVYVNESYRGQGIGSKLVAKVIAVAKESNCYKLIATSRTSRPKVHQLYQRLGFDRHGIEFRMDL